MNLSGRVRLCLRGNKLQTEEAAERPAGTCPTISGGEVWEGSKNTEENKSEKQYKRKDKSPMDSYPLHPWIPLVLK